MNTLHVRVLSPKQTIFEGSVLSVSSKNSSGEFDILPEHANFITLIENAPIILRVPKQNPIKFQFPTAIILNFQNQVRIYTGV